MLKTFIRSFLKPFFIFFKKLFLFLTELISFLTITGLSVVVTITLVSTFLTYEVQAFLHSTPQNFGEQSLIQEDTLLSKTELTPLKLWTVQLPNLETSHDSLATFLFSDFLLESNPDSARERIKKDLILKLFPFNTWDSIQPLVTDLIRLPIELLQLMVNDELYFILSEHGAVPNQADTISSAYYQWKHNRIVLYNHSSAGNAIIHEIGHWLESYIRHHIDYFYDHRITETMRSELEQVGLPDYLVDYSKTDDHEFFAVSFECFFYHYDLFKQKAPVTFSYLYHYLSAVLNLEPSIFQQPTH